MGRIIGNRETPLPEGAMISITRVEKLSFFRYIVNSILNRIIMKSMQHHPDLLFAEITGRRQGGVSQTVTVWRAPNALAPFVKRGSHGVAKKKFVWVFFGGEVDAYFLTRRANGVVPDAGEAERLVKQDGRYYKGGKLVRQAAKPSGSTMSRRPRP